MCNNIGHDIKPPMDDNNLVDFTINDEFEWKSLTAQIKDEEEYEKNDDPSIINDPN